MKTLNRKNKSSILWWMGWISLTILSFFISCIFWTWILSHQLGDIHETHNALIWVAFVFGTWMVFLFPLIIFMYNKVDRSYEESKIQREIAFQNKIQAGLPFTSILIDPKQRELTETLKDKVAGFSEAIKNGHLVTAHLKNGQKIEYVFIKDRSEILGVYNLNIPVYGSEVIDIEATDLHKLPKFEPEKWTRFDGIGI